MGTVLAVLAVFVSLFIREPYLVLTNAHSGTLLLRERTSEGEIFSIHFIHSVNKSPVTEIYEIRNGQIVLVALEFETFGAGMPTELESGQSLIRLPEGGMRIVGIDRVMEDFHYMIGYNSGLVINFGERQVPLDTLDAAGQPVRIALKQLNIWQRLLNII